MSILSPAARARLETLDAMHPLDRESYLVAMGRVVVERIDATALWQELLDRDRDFEIELARFVIDWLADSDEAREFVLGNLAHLETAP